MFNAEFYTQNRKKIKQAVGDELIIIAGNGLLQRAGDTNFAFRQDSNFLYVTGLSEPDLVLVINPNDNSERIIVPHKDEIAVIFDGDANHDELKAVSGVSTIMSEQEGWDYIKSCATKKAVHFNMPSEPKSRGLFTNPARAAVHAQLTKIGAKPKDIRRIMASLRMIKQPQEIAAITQAIHITKSALSDVAQHINAATNESDLLKVLSSAFINENVEHSFAPLIQAGKNATTLHYDKNNQPVHASNAILLDVGAEYAGYAADISRTYVKGKNDRAAAVIAAVKNVQSNLIAQVKPGVTWNELSEKALDMVADELLALKVITNKKDAQKYFPHAFGHFLGLDVHDVGDYSQPLAENMVITVEPGIYIPEEAIGVRFEDDILVTKTGAKVL